MNYILYKLGFGKVGRLVIQQLTSQLMSLLPFKKKDFNVLALVR